MRNTVALCDSCGGEIHSGLCDTCATATSEQVDTLTRERNEAIEHERQTRYAYRTAMDNQQREIIELRQRAETAERERDETRAEVERLTDELPDALRTILLDHWPVRLICDHEAKTDQVVCSCSGVRLPVRETTGAAIGEWIEHVMALLQLWEPSLHAVKGPGDADAP